MDDLATYRPRAGSDDLASIVLGATAAPPRAGIGPERVPVELRGSSESGYDARSVAVLALVVALIAALGGWLTSVGEDPVGGADGRTAERPAASDVTTGDAPTVGAVPGDAGAIATTTAPVRGVDLAVGQLAGSRDATGSAVVTVGVTNDGTQRYAGRAGASVLVLMDGDVVGSRELAVLAPGAGTRVAVPLGWCPTGSNAITAVLDPGAAVREGDERNNATTRSLEFGC